MFSAEAQVHPYASARLNSFSGVRIREDTLYCDHKGEAKKGIRKRAEKALDKLQEFLRRVLQPDEVVLYIARGQAPVSGLERFFMGWYAYYATGVILVLTNRRLLHFLVTRDGSWRRSLRAVSWGDMAEAKVKGWLGTTLTLKYRDGRKEEYWGVRGQDGKVIRLVLSTALPPSGGEATATQGTVSLCPGCFTALTPGIYQCGKCSLSFKDEKTMVRRSLLIPGGGYFYCRQWFLGIGDFIAGAVLLLWILGAVLAWMEEQSRPAQASGEPSDPTRYLVLVVFFVGIFVLERLFAIHHCRRFIREYIPLE